jgi:hypothetical protein
MSCILCSDAQGWGSRYAQLKTFFYFALAEQIIGTLAHWHIGTFLYGIDEGFLRLIKYDHS